MKILKYIALTLILLNIPTFSLHYLGPLFGSITNLLLFVSVIIYFFFAEKSKPVWPFIVLGICFFIFSGLQYSGDTTELIKDAVRYFIFIICVNQITKKTTDTELLIFLLIGALSIAVNAIVFPDSFGRYGGFYLNANKAGFICLFGFTLSYIIKNYKLKLLIQFTLIVCGIFTLSRSFLLFLVVINLVSIFANKKNIQTLAIGSIALVFIFTASTLQLNKARFSALKSVFSSSEEIETQTITEGSRDETWFYFSDLITNNIIAGAGYKSMRGASSLVTVEYGVHNTFLMVLGEAGIIAFLLIVIIYLAMTIRSFKYLRKNQEYAYLAIAIVGYLMVAHNYFEKYDVLFVSIWLYHKVRQEIPLEVENIEE
ncbi:O-antigen ligase domain-containing protein [Bizionia argentinensis JUB59]|uniref:O-antigen ligase domain-containing protein n=1 Tax=Bizionia argentinensis JUB59 TaxID=1046627 RepID=G2E9B5_9FLAO|nr:O-antigen ligase family protein [Bizionia argentinensis]EGV44763.1 O-antigen ligase domain-containing protein [Bizionia argentinensis JUB59]